jgi:hypothetical protein
MIFKINKSDERNLNAVFAIITRGEKEAGGQNYAYHPFSLTQKNE